MRTAPHGRSWLRTVALLVPCSLAGVSCHDDSPQKPVDPVRPPSAGAVECEATTVFYPSRFGSNSAQIDNVWFPLVPGTQVVFDGVSNRGGGLLPHRVVFTVTDLVKEIDGVLCVVMWDRDYNNGELQESELAFFAQDLEGTVWNTGEYPEEYLNGEFVGAPSTWISGVSGAEAGIHMLANPVVDTRYLQGFAPDVNFLDCAFVYSVGGSTCVPYNCYENILVVDERSPLDPGSGHQRKYHAPGVGVVRIGAVEDPEGETLVVTNIRTLGPQEMAEARRAALVLERRAYEVSEDYRATRPSRRR